ncbi:hypothetical protein PENARI_c038G08881 [Penicillium arizonense]|uniref:Uncharacterized protein n=2 Tax=Penicillium TaxID=5073 RepID=A0A1F5L392_PENAI|nr:hypothetical protein PENARI_c038G08881 [Penicillium arizonense]OGE47698.1 hypothetical protein PENARI_c038G08881 [Penicillium arizonense]
MLNWSNEEILITIYFVARCIRPKSVQGLLLRRGYDRSLAAIERTIICTTKQYPYLKFANGQWDLSAIDRWMKDFVRSQESVNKLTRFSLEDAEDMVLKISVDDLLETMDNLGLDFTDPAFNART